MKKTSEPPTKLTDKQIRHAYCENESIYGYTCGDKDCPHCGGKAGGNTYFERSRNATKGKK